MPPTREEIDLKLLEYLREAHEEKRDRVLHEQRLERSVDRMTLELQGLRSDFVAHAADDKHRFERFAERLSDLDGDIEDTESKLKAVEEKPHKDLEKRWNGAKKGVVGFLLSIVLLIVGAIIERKLGR